MRPKSTTSDLPSSYGVKVHLHNKFVKHIASLKKEIIVSNLSVSLFTIVNTYLHRQPPERSQSLKMDGQPTQRRQGFRE